VVRIDGFGWFWGLTGDFAFVFEGSSMKFIFAAEVYQIGLGRT
jgi:hypothetical protein